MAFLQRVNCSQDEYESLPTDSNIVIEVNMVVGGESFNNALIIDDYRLLETKELMKEIDKQTAVISRMYGAVFAGRKELMERNK